MLGSRAGKTGNLPDRHAAASAKSVVGITAATGKTEIAAACRTHNERKS